MDLDDPFSEPVVAKAPTVGRFQPKAKPRPKKGPSAVVKATKKLSVESEPQDPVSNQSIQLEPNNNLEEKSEDPVSLSFTVAENLVNVIEDGNFSIDANEVARPADNEHSEVAACNTGGIDMGVDTSLESQSPTNITGIDATAAEWPAETPMPDASSIQNEEEISDLANVSFTSAPTLKPCNSSIAPDESIDKTVQDSECFKESIDRADGDFELDVEHLEAGDFSCLDTIINKVAAASEKKAVKYQPKPKALSDRQKDSANVLHMSPDGNFSINSFICQSESVVSEEAFLENQQQRGEELGEREFYDALDSSAKSAAEGILSGFEGNDNCYNMLDGRDGDNSSLHDRVPDEEATNKNENNDVDHIGEEYSPKKRRRKSKIVASENDKPARKRRKAVQASDEEQSVKKRRKAVQASDEDTIVKPPKKFPRGTRRKRCVDKSLVEVPEDELDLQRVPIKDLILLAEYKERLAKKEAAAASTLQPPSESTENMFTEDPLYDDNETLGFDQDGDNPSTSGVVSKDTGYYNYQTYMKKEPRARWTKHDTELFYQAISQFGSDLSMVQQLFPGRTRHQIKLKYKKEERQNPMRLNDALTNRAQDLSHFELVIARLQEQANQEANSDKEDSVCPTGKDEGPDENLTTNNEDVPDSKQNKEDEPVEQELNKSQVESSPKSYYSGDEDFDWSQYKSEF